jgi:hypothetical protein
LRYLKFAYITALLCNIPLFVLIYQWFPQYRYRLLNEDSTLESLTVLLFLLAFLVLGAASLQRRPSRQHAYLPVAGLALLAALDELSFGERIFDFQPIMINGRHRIDAVHDIAPMLYTMLQENIAVAVGLGLLAGGITLWAASRYWQRLANVPSLLQRYPAYGYVIAAATLIIAAIGIDLVAESQTLARLVEEVLEMNAGLGMLAAGVAAHIYTPVSHPVHATGALTTHTSASVQAPHL